MTFHAPRTLAAGVPPDIAMLLGLWQPHQVHQEKWEVKLQRRRARPQSGFLPVKGRTQDDLLVHSESRGQECIHPGAWLIAKIFGARSQACAEGSVHQSTRVEPGRRNLTAARQLLGIKVPKGIWRADRVIECFGATSSHKAWHSTFARERARRDIGSHPSRGWFANYMTPAADGIPSGAGLQKPRRFRGSNLEVARS